MDLLTADEGKRAAALARDAIEHAVLQKPASAIPLTPVFEEKRGVFVTLTKAGELRGCIGFPYPVIPLGDAIRQAAVAAAREDPRFPAESVERKSARWHLKSPSSPFPNP